MLSQIRYLVWFLVFFLPGNAIADEKLGVYFVGGTYSNVDPRQAQKFVAQKEVLNQFGIPWRDARIKSTRPYTESVEPLSEQLTHSDFLEHVIVSHSAGGLMTLDALLEYPYLQYQLAGWVAYQAPFYGASPVERITRTLDLFDPFRLRRVMDITGIHRLSALTTRDERLPHMRRNDSRIRRLTSCKTVVCVTSDTGRGTDDMVDTRSMTLPGSVVIDGGNANHMDLVMGGKGSRSHQKYLFCGALSYLGIR